MIRVRRRKTVLDSYDLAGLLLAYDREVKANDNPNITFELEKKLSGKWYLIKVDYRELPDLDEADLIPQIELPDWRDLSPQALADREEYRKRDQENLRRVKEFLKKHEHGLKGALGS